MSQWYCAFPFRHVFVDSTGLSPCCNTVNSFGLDVGIEEYKSHPKLLNLQKQFLNGEKPVACSMCQFQEKIQNKSMRLDGLADYKHEVFESSQFDFIHFSQSNLCNFKCRSCGPVYSHGIAEEVRRHPELINAYQEKKFIQVNQNNYQWIIDNLLSLKRLLLTGGEPTVMPEVRKLFEHLIKNPQPELQVMMTTNCSWTDDFWFQLIDTMPNLHITASVDGVGSAAELIRHGTVWNQVEHNVRWLSKHAWSLDINTVVSYLNVINLYPLLKFCREVQIKSMSKNGGRQGDLGLRHQFSVASGLTNIISFPDDIKIKILENLNQCLTIDLDPEQRRMVQGLIITITNSKFDSEKWSKIMQYHTTLDKIRNENHLELFLDQ
jgi:organic radical activating enzyme